MSAVLTCLDFTRDFREYKKEANQEIVDAKKELELFVHVSEALRLAENMEKYAREAVSELETAKRHIEFRMDEWLRKYDRDYNQMQERKISNAHYDGYSEGYEAGKDQGERAARIKVKQEIADEKRKKEHEELEKHKNSTKIVSERLIDVGKPRIVAVNSTFEHKRNQTGKQVSGVKSNYAYRNPVMAPYDLHNMTSNHTYTNHTHSAKNPRHTSSSRKPTSATKSSSGSKSFGIESVETSNYKTDADINNRTASFSGNTATNSLKGSAGPTHPSTASGSKHIGSSSSQSLSGSASGGSTRPTTRPVHGSSAHDASHRSAKPTGSPSKPAGLFSRGRASSNTKFIFKFV